VHIEEVVVGFASVLVVLGLGAGWPDLDHAAVWLGRLLARPSGADRIGDRGPSVTHVLPVVFDGPDLHEVAEALGTTTEAVVELMVAAELEVAFVGFAPGFPYLTGVPDELAALPRRATPRTRVPAGSVAVAAGFASVYPQATPGGWNLLGRTTETLFDPFRHPHSRVSPGDSVRFVLHHPPSGFPVAEDGPRPLLDAGDRPALVVVEPGLLDIVQDGGRSGVAALGVPRAGAADPRALALVNHLLGNDPGAPAIESTGTGLTVRMVGDGHVAVVGAGVGAVDVQLDGHPVPDATVVPVGDGQVLSVGRIRRGLRAYLGVAGGLDTPVLLGSRSSDVLCGLGPGRLRTGDQLARRVPGRVRGRLDHPGPTGSAVTTVRVLPGPHTRGGDGTGDERFRRLVSTDWRVGSAVDRVGVRLVSTGSPPPLDTFPVDSTPMVTGAVQLPPDGRPIVLLPDHATVGGYPVVACVVTADLPLLGQLAPDDPVALEAVDGAVAADAYVRAAASDAAAVAGWYPTAAGT
jgi:KipI family sensor histidine kinase inhibitor